MNTLHSSIAAAASQQQRATLRATLMEAITSLEDSHALAGDILRALRTERLEGDSVESVPKPPLESMADYVDMLVNLTGAVQRRLGNIHSLL